MIVVQNSDFSSQIKASVALIGVVAKDKEAKKAIAGALHQGAKIIVKQARSFAPKAGRKKRGQTKNYGKTGLLKRSYTSKKGVSKKGKGEPYAVVGPSKKITDNIKRGRRIVKVYPSNYAHLVEFGFNVHHRVPGVSGRNHEKYVKKGVLWKSSDLEKYIADKKHIYGAWQKKRVAKFLVGSGQGTSTVAGQHIVKRAYDSTRQAVATKITSSMAEEFAKAIQKEYMRQVRKYNPSASGLRGVR